MDPLALVITTAGLTRFTAAQLSEDIDLTVATVGLTAAAFVAAPTLTALPGEFKRLTAVSGQAVSEALVHMTVRDASTDAYTVRGFGLFLADGTLFAVYGGAGVVVEKSALSTTLLALDIAFPAGHVDLIKFGDTNFLYPPATETVRGVARIATQADTDTGTDDQRIVTPKKLAARLAAIIATITGKAASAITITGGGLAAGGGDLTANRAITVPAASAAEADAGTIATKALTPASLANILGVIAGKAASATKVWGGGLATGGGDLSQDRTITVPAASAAEADAGTLATKALTPASLANILGVIAGKAASATKVWGAGLATGGGDLSQDRTITVPKASGADVRAGTDDAKAITPAALAAGYQGTLASPGWIRHPNGLIEQWGSVISTGNGGVAVVFPIPFPNAVYNAVATNGSNGGAPAAWAGITGLSLTGMTIVSASAAGADAGSGIGSYWRALGR